MYQKFWIQILLLALLKSPLYFFRICHREMGHCNPQEGNSMQIKITQPPMQVSENSFSWDTIRTPSPAPVEKGISTSTNDSRSVHRFSDSPSSLIWDTTQQGKLNFHWIKHTLVFLTCFKGKIYYTLQWNAIMTVKMKSTPTCIAWWLSKILFGWLSKC